MLEQYITSFVDGRLRLRHQILQDTVTAEQVKLMLPSVPGIQKADVNTRTGSLLVCYDSQKLNRQSLLALLLHWEQMTGLDASHKVAAPSCLDKARSRLSRLQIKRIANRAMLGTLAASLALGLSGRTRGHVLTGGLFLALNTYHLWAVRKSL